MPPGPSSLVVLGLRVGLSVLGPTCLPCVAGLLPGPGRCWRGLRPGLCAGEGPAHGCPPASSLRGPRLSCSFPPALSEAPPSWWGESFGGRDQRLGPSAGQPPPRVRRLGLTPAGSTPNRWDTSTFGKRPPVWPAFLVGGALGGWAGRRSLPEWGVGSAQALGGHLGGTCPLRALPSLARQLVLAGKQTLAVAFRAGR